MNNLPEYRKHCSYCYKTTKDCLTFCCNIPICPDHIHLHADHTPLYSVLEQNNNISINSSTLTENEKADLINYIKSYSSNVYPDSIKIDCPHLINLSTQLLTKFSTESKIICSFPNCGIDENLYICLECAYVGCSRVQFDSKGNGHALDHFTTSQHNLTTAYDCLNIFGSNKTYCYKCDDYVRVNNIREYFSKMGLDYGEILRHKIKNNDKAGNKPENIESTADCVQPLCGIENAGNTCYITAVLYLLSFNAGFTEDHYLYCARNPFDCFLCQIIRITNTLRTKLEERENCTTLNKISILNFIEIIENEIPIFQRPYQQDSNEFLMFLLLKIKEYWLVGEIGNVVDEYQINVLNEDNCQNCGFNNKSENESYSLSMEFSSNFENAIENFQAPKVTSCKCGGNRIESNSITKTSEFLILVINLFKLTANMKFEKNVSEFNADEILYLNKLKYKKICQINHIGENLVTGHYVTEIDNYIIDDEKVTRKNEKSGQGYIFLYKRFN